MKTLLKALNDRSPLASTERPDDQFEARWRDGLKRRVLVALCAVGLWGTGVEARLVFLQVVQHQWYVGRAALQQQHELHPAAGRGDIVDRNGEILAYSIKAASIVAAPSALKSVGVAKTVDALCGAFRDCTPKEREDLLARLSAKGSYAPVRRAMNLSTEQIDRVRALKLPGVTLIPDSRRFYPKLDLAAHVLGYVGIDNNGLAGIEGAYDDQIRGEDGLVYTQLDGRQRQMEMRVERDATDGATIELTLDGYLQYIAERELKASVESEHADGGTVLVMNPNTGEILAMASYPSFDPNAFGKVTAEQSRNQAIQGIYEPGSTFKIVTASAGLEEGVWSMNDTVDCAPGRLTIGGRTIKDSQGHNYGVLSFEDVIVKSSNVGAAKIALRVGADRFARYVSRLGFGQTLLPDLKGESRGLVANFKNVHDSSLASMAMGYEVGVTPLQMAAAVSAVANGGTLYQPRLVRSITRNGVREDVVPKVLRLAIAKETAATLTSIMEEVVRRGTGTKAAMAAYQVAGKTGTAKKAISGRYSETNYNASFVGFVPSNKPELTIVVVIDTPRTGSYYGGDVAAPVFKRIAEAALEHLAVPRTINPRAALMITADAMTPPPAPAREPALIQVSGQAHMPDVRGLGLREAVQILTAAGLDVRPTGSGVVTAQSPLPGAPVESGDRSLLQVGRPPVDPRATTGGGR